MENKPVYRYACLMRPPGPGAAPREGMISCSFEPGSAPSGHHHWGVATYNRILTDKEVYNYELEPLFNAVADIPDHAQDS